MAAGTVLWSFRGPSCAAAARGSSRRRWRGCCRGCCRRRRVQLYLHACPVLEVTLILAPEAWKFEDPTAQLTCCLFSPSALLHPCLPPDPPCPPAGARALPPLVPPQQAKRRVQRLHHGAGLCLAGGALGAEGGAPGPEGAEWAEGAEGATCARFLAVQPSVSVCLTGGARLRHVLAAATGPLSLACRSRWNLRAASRCGAAVGRWEARLSAARLCGCLWPWNHPHTAVLGIHRVACCCLLPAACLAACRREN